VRFGIEARCRSHGTEIVKVFHSDALPDPALLQSVAGVIVIGKHSDTEISWLTEHCRHIVFADFDPHSDTIDCVHPDVGAATRKILNELNTMGYQRIAFIGSFEHLNGETLPFGELRCKAYISWQKEHGRFDSELLALGDSCDSGQNLRLETGYMLAQRILKLKSLPDIILTANDNMAIGTYRAVSEAGLKIPDDIAVVSFNDIPVAQFLTPPLSTVKIHGEHIGETAVDLLLERLAGRDYTKNVTIASEMIWRDSCRKPITIAPSQAQ
jgi:LacI family transcriptional regulator